MDHIPRIPRAYRDAPGQPVRVQISGKLVFVFKIAVVYDPAHHLAAVRQLVFGKQVKLLTKFVINSARRKPYYQQSVLHLRAQIVRKIDARARPAAFGKPHHRADVDVLDVLRNVQPRARKLQNTVFHCGRKPQKGFKVYNHLVVLFGCA